LEVKLNTDIATKLQQAEQAYQDIKTDHGRLNKLIQARGDEVVKLESTMKEYVDLIEVLNEKTTLQNEALKDTRTTFAQKFQTIES
jgi:hypothetical protein